MRIASIQLDGRPVYGRVDGDQIVVAEAALLARCPALADLLAADAVAELAAADGFKVPLEDAVLTRSSRSPARSSVWASTTWRI